MKRIAFVCFFAMMSTAAVAGTTKTPAFLVYEEGGDTISFFPPRTVRIVHGATASAPAHACQYDLPDNGNMYSGADVENAFKNAVVQSEMHAHHMYRDTGVGRVTSGTDEMSWTLVCHGACVPEPPPVAQLHQTLRTVLLNARSVCP
jgi:hypothetical protein